jgi:hypothetical protein
VCERERERERENLSYRKEMIFERSGRVKAKWRIFNGPPQKQVA